MQHDFGVGAPAKLNVKVADQLGAQVSIVVDFTVKNADETPAGRHHRLVASRRDINDGEPPKSESYAAFGIGPVPFIVWPTVRHRTGHSLRDLEKAEF